MVTNKILIFIIQIKEKIDTVCVAKTITLIHLNSCTNIIYIEINLETPYATNWTENLFLFYNKSTKQTWTSSYT